MDRRADIHMTRMRSPTSFPQPSSKSVMRELVDRFMEYCYWRALVPLRIMEDASRRDVTAVRFVRDVYGEKDRPAADLFDVQLRSLDDGDIVDAAWDPPGETRRHVNTGNVLSHLTRIAGYSVQRIWVQSLVAYHGGGGAFIAKPASKKTRFVNDIVAEAMRAQAKRVLAARDAGDPDHMLSYFAFDSESLGDANLAYFSMELQRTQIKPYSCDADDELGLCHVDGGGGMGINNLQVEVVDGQVATFFVYVNYPPINPAETIAGEIRTFFAVYLNIMMAEFILANAA